MTMSYEPYMTVCVGASGPCLCQLEYWNSDCARLVKSFGQGGREVERQPLQPLDVQACR